MLLFGQPLVTNCGNGFSPADIPGLRLWLKASAGTFTDAGGATPAAVDGEEVGLWKDLSGNGYDVTQDTASKKPLLKLGANGINGQATLLFDGVDDILLRTVANWLIADSAGSVFVVARLSAGYNTSNTYLASFDDASAASYGVLLTTYTSGSHRMRMWQHNAPGEVIDDLVGNTALTASNPMILAWRSDGSDYFMRVNGIEQTLSVLGGSNSGDWFADTNYRDNFSVGAYKFNAEGSFLKGSLSEILVYNANLTGDDLARVESYLNERYGV